MLPMLLRVAGLLAVLATIGVVLVGLVTMAAALVLGQRRLLQRAGVFVGSWLAAYAVAVAIGVVVPGRRSFGPGEALEFCGLDCHLHVAVSAAADGTPGAVTLRLWSDARSEPEFPSHLRIRAIDAEGREYAPLERGIGDTLLAGASVERTLHFAMPAGTRAGHLTVTWGDWEDYLVPGPENRFVQQRRTLLLPATPPSSPPPLPAPSPT